MDCALKMRWWCNIILLLFVAACRSDPLDDDWDLVIWDPTGAGGMVWEDLPSVNITINATHVDSLDDLSFPDAVFEEDSYLSDVSHDLVWTPANITHSPFNLNASNSISMGSVNELIDFAFMEEERKLYDQLDTIFENLFSTYNNTVEYKGPWSFVTFVTVMPLRCSEVHKIAALFDAAMLESNPGSEIVSTAQRLGQSMCGQDGACPCKDVRRYSTRVMELRSTSRQRDLKPPTRFPYPVEILKRP